MKSLLRQILRIPGQVPLRSVLVVPFVLQIFGAVGLTGWLSLRNGQEAVNEVTIQLRNEVSGRIQQRLQDYLEAPRIIAQINTDAIQSGQLNIADTGSLTRQFWRQRFLFDAVNLSAIYFGSEMGEFIGLGFQADNTWQIGRGGKSTNGKFHSYGTDRLGNPSSLVEIGGDYDPRIRPWYRNAVEAGQATWSDIYADFKELRLKVTLVQPVYRDDILLGVVGVDFVFSHINEFLESLKIGKSGQTFIIERSGLPIATSTPQQLFIIQGENVERIQAKDANNPLISQTAEYLESYFGDFHKITSSQQLAFRLNGDRQFLQVVPFADGENLDWLIVVVVPEADFMERINANTRTTILLCLVALLVATLLGLVTSRWITKPIMRLSAASQELARHIRTPEFAHGELFEKVEVKAVDELGVLAESFNLMAQQLQESFEALEKTNAELELRVEQRTKDLQTAKEDAEYAREQSDRLLLNILPAPIAERLKVTEGCMAEGFEQATVMFADIVGFTPLSARVSPLELVSLLNQIFSEFDQLTEKHGLEKIKTIGDAYMVAAGLPVPRTDHAEAIAQMALDMQDCINSFQTYRRDRFQIRIGINTGPVVAGVIGTKKFIYDLWGDTVNVASRMESQGNPGKIQVTQATYEILQHKFLFVGRGAIAVKGKGEMTTYWLTGRKKM